MDGKEEAYKDISIFEGIEQFYDSEGVEWRVLNDLVRYTFYKREKGEGDFTLDGFLKFKYKKAKNTNLKSLYRLYNLKKEFDEDNETAEEFGMKKKDWSWR